MVHPTQAGLPNLFGRDTQWGKAETMNQAVGLIEINTQGATATCDFAEGWDDATLEGLFARLIASDEYEMLESPDQVDGGSSTILLAANLDDLAQDLRLATRHVLADIFLGPGGRR
jgi:hypothetical protein